MFGRHAATMRDLPAAGLAIADRQVATSVAHKIEQPGPYIHPDLVLLFFEAVGASNPAALGLALIEPQPRYQLKDIASWQADPMGAQLAGRVVGQRALNWLEIGVERLMLSQIAQELEDIEGVRGERTYIRVVQLKDFGGLLLERQGAASTRADDRNALLDIRSKLAHIIEMGSARLRKIAVRDQR